jgi:hypothetical protein
LLSKKISQHNNALPETPLFKFVYDGEYALEAKTRSKSGITNLERTRILCKVQEEYAK